MNATRQFVSDFIDTARAVLGTVPVEAWQGTQTSREGVFVSFSETTTEQTEIGVETLSTRFACYVQATATGSLRVGRVFDILDGLGRAFWQTPRNDASLGEQRQVSIGYEQPNWELSGWAAVIIFEIKERERTQ